MSTFRNLKKVNPFYFRGARYFEILYKKGSGSIFWGAKSAREFDVWVSNP